MSLPSCATFLVPQRSVGVRNKPFCGTEHDGPRCAMKSLLRPWLLIVVLMALLLGAAAVFFDVRPAVARPAPLPVGKGDREIVWLYPATNGTTWERFVTAVRLAADQLRADFPNIQVQTSDAFPPQTTAVPEVALVMPGGGRLLFRW